MAKLKYKKIFGFALVMIAVSLVFVGLSLAHASPAATGTISAVFVNNTTGAIIGSTQTLPSSPNPIGTQVYVQLEVTGASNLAGVKTDISWNNNVLKLTEVDQGDSINGGFPGYTGGNNGYYPEDFIGYSSSAINRGQYQETDVSVIFSGSSTSEVLVDDNGNGYVSGGISEIRTDGSVTPLTSGVFATLTFNVIGYGTSSITLANGIASNPDNPIVNTPVTTNSATLTVSSSNTLCKLTVTSAQGTASAVTPLGILWDNSGTSVTCTAPSSAVAAGITYTCTGWTGTGSVPASGTATTATFTITADSTLTWNWQNGNSPTPTPTSSSSPTPTPTTSPTPTPTPTSSSSPTPTPTTVSLTVSSEQGSPTPSVGISNYNSGVSVTCSVKTNPVIENGATYNTVTENGVTYVCTGWTGTGSVPASGSSTSTTFTITANSGITLNWVLLPPSLDIWTNKGGQGWNVSANAFGPQEQVTIIANVTSGGGVPVAQATVTFNINDNGALIDSRTATTDSTGIATVAYGLPWSNTNPTSAFGIMNITSTVSVAGVSLNDSCAFMYNYVLNTTSLTITNNDGHSSPLNGPYFSRYTGPSVSATVTVRNINWTTTSSFYLVATIYDNNSVPIAYVSLPETINPAQTGNPYSVNSQTYTISLKIPSYAFVGPATLYVNIYTNSPTNLGIPFCPEASTPLSIDASQ
jgi:hypothetical protein